MSLPQNVPSDGTWYSAFPFISQNMPRILNVSYDESLLTTREALLKQAGYEVVSAQGFVESLERCKQRDFDLFILGHSIPQKDKQELVKTFRDNCSAPILSLLRNCDTPLDTADFHVEPEPKQVLQAVAEILQRR